MKLLLHLYKFWWAYLIVAGALTGAGLYIHHSIFESGRAAEKAVWQPLFQVAERELAAANARTREKEKESSRVVAESQRRIDETLQTLHARSVDYDSRLRSLSVRYTAAAARRCDLPEASGASASPNAAARINERAERAGTSFRLTGERCERDAARLAELQRLYTEQRAIINQ